MKRCREDICMHHQHRVPHRRVSPLGHGSAHVEELAGGAQNDARAYFNYVKDLFEDKWEKYDEFLQALKDFRARRIDIAGVRSRINHIFEGHNDFILGFNVFLPKFYQIYPSIETEKLLYLYVKAIKFLDALKKESENDKHLFRSYLDILIMYEFRRINITEVFQKIATIFYKHKSLLEYFNIFHLKNRSELLMLHAERKDSDLDHMFQELAGILRDNPLKLCSNPNYHLIQKIYQNLPFASGQIELGASVLNDQWVSMASGSINQSYKHKPRNKYQEALFQYEDQRFELDLLIESADATIKQMEESVVRINDTKEHCNPACIEDDYSVMNLRCIEPIYHEYGLDMLDKLRKSETQALPFILNCLKQKREEWSQSLSNLDQVWAKVHADNYHNSLNHHCNTAA